MTFISESSNTITLDGSAPDAPKTLLDGKEVVQLRRVRTPESNFEWDGRSPVQIVAKNISICDEQDLSCLYWFISEDYPIDFTGVDISVQVRDSLKSTLELFDKGVAPGSKINLSLEAGSSDMGGLEELVKTAKNIGFEVVTKNVVN